METKIDKTKTALVVIGLQKGIVGRQTAPQSPDVVVKNAAALAEACRKNAMPVFLVRVTPSPDGKDALHPLTDIGMWTRSQKDAPNAKATSAAGRQQMPADFAEIVSELGPKPGDFVVTKHQWGAFYGTELDLELRRRGIGTIILCGISTNIGVESTARFAYELGYNQIFAEDAMSAMSEEEHNFTVTKTFPRIGLVRKTAEILAGLSEI
jgi:nicotinamidase-related amidase